MMMMMMMLLLYYELISDWFLPRWPWRAVWQRRPSVSTKKNDSSISVDYDHWFLICLGFVFVVCICWLGYYFFSFPDLCVCESVSCGHVLTAGGGRHQRWKGKREKPRDTFFLFFLELALSRRRWRRRRKGRRSGGSRERKRKREREREKKNPEKEENQKRKSLN